MEDLQPRPANSSPLTPLGFLERAATVYGECISIVYNNLTFTWSETHRRCLQLASSLYSLGIKKAEVVSVVAPNTPAMYELQFAVPMSGAILNNVNTRLDAHTISVILRHAESKLVFVDHQSTSLVLEAIALFPPNTPCPPLVLIDDNYEETENKVLSPINYNFCCTYNDLVQNGDPGFKWVRPKSEWDPVVLNYTSGTTASPKGVVHCHRGIFVMSVDALLDWNVPKQPVYLWTLPIFHANGWSFPWGMAAVGGTNVCLRKFDASIIYDLIERVGVTHMCGAPIVLNMLSNGSRSEPLKNPVHILTAGAPPPAPVLFRTESLGFVVSHAYGLTETAGLNVSCAWKHEWERLPASEKARLKARQGVARACATGVDVLDAETGRSTERDGSSLGEVVLKGACVMLGYLKDPKATQECMTPDGWFRTGDVGVMHPDGYLEIKDRAKDVIISGGENLSSVEVESVLYSHPAVHEAAVVARPDKFWGERACAVVSLNPEFAQKPPSEKEIREYCKEKLPRYMVPRTVIFSEELPKTSTGKIQKFKLREMVKRKASSACQAFSGFRRCNGLMHCF